MPINRVTYYNQAVFSGPSPNTGYCFIDGDGNYTNTPIPNPDNISLNSYLAFNLNQQINYVQSFSYGFDIQRNNVLELGSNGYTSTPIIQNPNVTIELETLQNGIHNEIKLGLLCNFTSFISGRNNVAFYDPYPNSLSGFYTKDKGQITPELYYPRRYSDKKNLYLKLADQENEIASMTSSEQMETPSMAFGSCYLVSYITSARVGDFPRSKFSFVADNIEVNAGSYGYNPALNPITADHITASSYLLPTYRRQPAPQIISPNNINLYLENLGGGLLSGAGFDWNDLKIQSYSIDFSIEREALNSLVNKAPIFKMVRYPVIANINIEAVVGESEVSSVAEMFKVDNKYGVKIVLKNNCQYTGEDEYLNTLCQYDFSCAYLRSSQYSAAIGRGSVVQLSFTQEIDPSRSDRYMSISGFAYGRHNETYTTTYNIPLSGVDFIHRSGDNIYIRGSI